MKSSSNTFLVFLLGLVAIASAGTSIYFYRQSQSLKAKSTSAIQEENKKLLAKVGALILLPTDEEPTIATVTDPERLRKNQPFFANAEVGDKVLIYTGVKKAILYDPVANKIIEVAPITIGNQASASGGAAATSTTATKATKK